MPWEERSLMDVRLRFVQDVHRPGWSVAEVCRRYQVSRKTGHGPPDPRAPWPHRPPPASRAPLSRKAETARPLRRTLAAQQRRFDWFRERYNAERPHEALGQRLPASLYQASPRPYPTTLLPITYPGHYEVRRVSRNGGIRWGSRWVNVSHVLAELDVGFEEIDDGLRTVGGVLRSRLARPAPRSDLPNRGSPRPSSSQRRG